MAGDTEAGTRGGAEFVDLGIPGYEQPVEIGRGGFARVFRAWQPAFDRPVAIKLLTMTFDAQSAARFERECKAIGALSGHPNIATVYDHGATQSGQPFIVMEYLSGGALADELEQRGRMPWSTVATIGVKLAGALESAHRAHVLHRDLKPENVLVSRFDEPKLADFGIARIGDESVTKSGVITATVGHAAPEILLGDGRPTMRSDIYSLGSTLFTLLAGSPPFVRPDDEGVLAILNRLASAQVPDLRPFGVPSGMCRVIEQALARDPSSRQTTAAQLAAQLQAVQAQAGFAVTPLPIETRRPGSETGGKVAGAGTWQPAGTAEAGWKSDPPAATVPRHDVGSAAPLSASGPPPLGSPEEMAPPPVPAAGPPPVAQPPTTAVPGQTVVTPRPEPTTKVGPPAAPGPGRGRAWLWIAAAMTVTGLVVGAIVLSRRDSGDTAAGPATTAAPVTPTSAPTTSTVLAPLRPETPDAIAVGADGSVFVADRHRILRLQQPDGPLTVFAGTGQPGFKEGNATDAQFNQPLGVAVTSDGSVYVADSKNNRVRQVQPNGTVITIAGTGEKGAGGDGGRATQAQLNDPVAVVVAPDGTIYIADRGNNRIRQVKNRQVTTLAGNGQAGFAGDGGPASQAQLNSPGAVEVDVQGRVLIGDAGNHRIRRVTPDGSTIVTVAGNDTIGAGGDGQPATQAQLDTPFGIVADVDGSIYIADASTQRVRRVGPDAVMTTFAGTGNRGFGGDNGPATKADLATPSDLALAPDGSLYVADRDNNRIRKVLRNGTIVTVAG